MNRRLATAAACLTACTAAQAQSNLTLYGSLDLGPNWVSNVNGQKAKRLTGGTTQPDRMGFRGTEDLGSGLAAQFGLEMGIAPDVGTQVNPTKFFNREARVGLASRTWGTVSMGHLTDAMFDYVGKYSNGYNLFNFNVFHPGNFDGLANTAAFDNAVKYASPVLGGAQVLVEAAAGEGGGRSTSAGANYVNGPFSGGIAYLRADKRALDIAGRVGITSALGRTFVPGVSVAMDRVSAYGIGARYAFSDKLSMNTVYTMNDIVLGSQNTKPKNFDIGTTYRFTEVNWVNAGYSNSRFDSVKWNYFNLMDLYWFSKRTQIYAQGAYMKASGTRGHAAMNGVGVSSTNTQTVLSVGIHHSF